MERSKVAEHWEANAEVWTRNVRAGYDIYRDAQNTPAFLAMLPPVKGLRGLDIGCGEGGNTRLVAGLGAPMHAVDVAPTFIRHARATEEGVPLGIDFQAGDGLALPFEDSTFDFVTAFMSLMDMSDQGRVLREAQRVLRQFSILHPCFVPAHRKVLRDAEGRPRAIEVGGYFDATEGRIDRWWFEALPPGERENRSRRPGFTAP